MSKPTADEFGAAWIKFVASTRLLLVINPDDRSLDQFMILRDHVLEIVNNDSFINELKAAWDVPRWDQTGTDDRGIGRALFEELAAFSRAVEVAQAMRAATPETPEGKRTTGTVAPEARKGWFGWWSSKGKAPIATAAPEGLKDFTGRWLDRASTIAESVKDLLDNLPWSAKAPIILFKELVDIFKTLGRKSNP